MKYMLIHCIDEDAERARRLQDHISGKPRPSSPGWTR